MKWAEKTNLAAQTNGVLEPIQQNIGKQMPMYLADSGD